MEKAIFGLFSGYPAKVRRNSNVRSLDGENGRKKAKSAPEEISKEKNKGSGGKKKKEKKRRKYRENDKRKTCRMKLGGKRKPDNGEMVAYRG